MGITMSDSKDELIRMFFDEEAILFGRFILTSGKESNYYINVKKLSTKPRALKLIAKLMAGEAQKRGITFDRVAGPELGAVPIATALALETEKPLVIVRKSQRDTEPEASLRVRLKQVIKFFLSRTSLQRVEAS